jgi:sulfite dehydrogenase (cytochrome) subunit B
MRIPRLFAHAMIMAPAALISTGVCYANPMTYELPGATLTYRPGPGMETAQTNCVTCHSVDYISTQPPNRGKAFWEAEVTKMIKAYHAPISDGDAKAIADYLATAY